MTNPNTIEIQGEKTIVKLCKFGAEHNMEGCSFTEILNRVFEELENQKKTLITEDAKKVYLVWNESGDECVGFTDKKDAKYASTGRESPMQFGVSCLASQFRDVYDDYADENDFKITEIMVESTSD